MEDAPSPLAGGILFVICYVIIPLIMVYRRGYLLNLCAKLKEIKGWIRPIPTPSEWSITSVRRLSHLEKAQIESLFIQSEIVMSVPVKTIYRVVVKIKYGKQTSYPLAKEIANYEDLWLRFHLEDGSKLDKDKVVIRKWEKSGNKSYWDIMPL